MMKRTDMHNSLLGKTIAAGVTSDDGRYILGLTFTDGTRIELAGEGGLGLLSGYWRRVEGIPVSLPIEDD